MSTAIGNSVLYPTVDLRPEIFWQIDRHLQHWLQSVMREAHIKCCCALKPAGYQTPFDDDAGGMCKRLQIDFAKLKWTMHLDKQPFDTRSHIAGHG